MREKKKGKAGAAVSFMTKKAVLKKLQISLHQFRKLCILKGIFPRDPKKKLKGKNKVYYYTKDILFLSHEPLLQKFREQRIVKRKIQHARGKNDLESVERLKKNAPKYNIDHIIKERYPSFTDALHDLDDALSLVFLFVNMPQTKKIRQGRIVTCLKLCREFQLYVIKTHALRKVFVSIKGIYYQAEIMDQTITWLAPHQYTQQIARDVDYRVMLSFLELYENLLGFVLFRLYTKLGLRYPPDHSALEAKEEQTGESALDAVLLRLDSQLNSEITQESRATKETEQRLATLDNTKFLGLDAEETKKKEESDEVESMEEDEFLQEHKKITAIQTLFKGCTFFLSREVPRRSLEFVIRCFGGEGIMDEAREQDESITHQIVDRSFQRHQYFSRTYLQPQWVYDSVNEKVLLPVSEYLLGVDKLPPHLSPFVHDASEGYIPGRRAVLDKMHEALSTGNPISIDPAPGGESEGEEEEEGQRSDASDEESEPEEASVEAKHAQELKAEMEGKAYSGGKQKKAREEKRGKSEEGKKGKSEEELLPQIMMTKKNKRLHHRMMYGIKKKQSENENLMEKRRKIEEAEKKKPSK